MSYTVRSPAMSRAGEPTVAAAELAHKLAPTQKLAPTHTRAVAPPQRTPTGTMRAVSEPEPEVEPPSETAVTTEMKAAQDRAPAPVPASTAKAPADSDVTQQWSRSTDAREVPPAPTWSANPNRPPPPMVTVSTEAEPTPTEDAQVVPAPDVEANTEANTKTNTETVRSDRARALVDGPLRAYAAAMSRVSPEVWAIGPLGTESTLQTGAVFPPMSEEPAVAGAPQLMIGEPISSGLDITAAALEQLTGVGVPGQTQPTVRAWLPSRSVAGSPGGAAANDPPDMKATMNMSGPTRAEVVVGAGDKTVSLAITTAGPHVVVDAQVSDEALAQAMRNELDDLRDALGGHELELSDMTFGESSQDDETKKMANAKHSTTHGDETETSEGAGDAANEGPRGGIRVVA